MNYADVSHQINGVNGFMGSQAQREFMFNLAKTTQVAAEIGSFKGLSAVIVLLGMNSVQRNAGSYYCIDTFEASNVELNSESTYDEFVRVTNGVDGKGQTKIVKGWSTANETLEQIPNNLDWVYIDGDHETTGVIADIQAYVPKVKQDGLILFHDHTWESVKSGIDKCVADGLIKHLCHFDDFGVYIK